MLNKLLSAKKIISLFIICLLLPLFQNITPANAADLSQFNPGFIVSDDVFFNGNAMSAAEIQEFLNLRTPNCTINNGSPSRAAGAALGSTFIAQTCLKNYVQSTPNMPAQGQLCSSYSGSSLESAASIIYKIARACNISPKVLLVLLEKEQSLVTDDWPTVRQFEQATGFSCYDNGLPCVKTYSGFFYQVWSAAKQFQNYGNAPFTWYPVGQTSNILYQANMPECGTKSVFIQNRATAALYYYTPYTPNDAALAAGYGRGDSCSAYGNRNFFNLFSDWFGSTRTNPAPRDPLSPIGAVSSIIQGPQKVRVSGWTFDPETSAPISIHVYLGGTYASGGTWLGSFNADQPSKFVETAYPSYGPNHAFSFIVPDIDVPTQACIYAINVGSGSNNLIDCSILVPGSGLPIGNFESVMLTGLQGNIQAWALDPDSNSPIKIHVYLGGPYGTGRWGGEFTTSSQRQDLLGSYPLYDRNYGLSISVPVSNGTTPICLYAIDTQIAGASSFMGCKSVTSLSGPPFGNLESVSSSLGTVQIGGWVIDPDTTSPVSIHAYADGRWAGSYTADATRQDVGIAYPGYGDTHGYSINIQQGLRAGETNNICLYGINIAAGYNSLIGCKNIRVAGGMPFGNLESVTKNGSSANVSGWMIDPDTIDAVAIHVYNNGIWAGAFSANSTRYDVGSLYREYGNQHGMNFSVPLNPGINQLCLYAINIGSGATNPLIGCNQVRG